MCILIFKKKVSIRLEFLGREFLNKQTLKSAVEATALSKGICLSLIFIRDNFNFLLFRSLGGGNLISYHLLCVRWDK